MRVKTT